MLLSHLGLIADTTRLLRRLLDQEVVHQFCQ